MKFFEIFMGFLAPVVLVSGTSTKKPIQPRVVEGQFASKGDYPPIVSLSFKSSSGEAPQDGVYESFCGGTIVHPKWVLTAAHCLTRNDFHGNQKNVRILVEFIDLSPGKRWEPDEAVFEVEDAQVHPNYQSRMKYANDVALLKIKGSFGSRPRAVLGTSRESYKGEAATAMGWGRTNHSEQNSYSRCLMKLTEKICQEDWITENFMSQVSSYDQELIGKLLICFAWKSKRGVNVRDSGGPLIFGPKKTLIGVANFIDTPKGSGITSYFQRVDAHVKWIAGTVCGDDEDVEVEVCGGSQKAAGSGMDFCPWFWCLGVLALAARFGSFCNYMG